MNNECEIPTTTTMDTKLIDTKENKINSQNFKNTKELNELFKQTK